MPALAPSVGGPGLPPLSSRRLRSARSLAPQEVVAIGATVSAVGAELPALGTPRSVDRGGDTALGTQAPRPGDPRSTGWSSPRLGGLASDNRPAEALRPRSSSAAEDGRRFTIETGGTPGGGGGGLPLSAREPARLALRLPSLKLRQCDRADLGCDPALKFDVGVLTSATLSVFNCSFSALSRATSSCKPIVDSGSFVSCPVPPCWRRNRPSIALK
mmetsp:Transcript_103/g.281  ORF Transcript_103/g.281 Transcript_103/m.281 type:complete len:216 (+) Transcript_103:133-780(+)